MNQKSFLFSLLLCINFFQSYTQTEDLFVANTIPIELISKANAVVRYNNIHIEVKNFDKMVFTNKRIVTVLNKEGDDDLGAFQHYDKNVNIKKIEARIYNALGEEIKKYKKKDFQDVSAVSGGTLYSDNRVKFLRYTPINFPYTILYEAEVEYSSTAFLPGWRPIEGFYCSTQNAEYKITNSSNVVLKVKTTNFENYNIEKLSDYHFIAANLNSIKPEAYRPSFKTYAPSLKAALTDFSMEGVRGINTNWEDFGKWMHDKLIVGTQELPQEVKTEIKNLTANAKTNLEKAKIVYEFMQNKTRYISVQVGIGGWKPMLAKDVDRLGYGDCKALTNYTKALLDHVGVESFYTVIYGNIDITNIDKDFSATQGNHVILSVPNNEDYVWLECTSQTTPFGYNANFTDDRDALLITPEGGKIVHTKIYETEKNIKETKALITLDELGNINAKLEVLSKGTRYYKPSRLEEETEKDIKLIYKEYWDYIIGLDIASFEVNNNKDDVIYTEIIEVNANKYATKVGDLILFRPNVFNTKTNFPPRYKNRTLPFEIDRGKIDKDEFKISFPITMQVEALQEDISIKNKFGEYSFSITQLDKNTLLYKREFKLNRGKFNKEDYNEFRDFMIEIGKNDNSKIALKEI